MSMVRTDELGVGRDLEPGYRIAGVFGMVGDALHNALEVLGWCV